MRDLVDDDPPPPGWPQLCGDLRMAVYGMTPAYKGLLMRYPNPVSAGQLVRARPTSEVSGRERPPIARSAVAKKKLRRNLVIAAAHKAGCSQRLLSEVFGLSRSALQDALRSVDGLAHGRE